MQKILIDYLKDYLPVLDRHSGGSTVEITGENVFQKGNEAVITRNSVTGNIWNNFLTE